MKIKDEESNATLLLIHNWYAETSIQRKALAGDEKQNWASGQVKVWRWQKNIVPANM